MGNWLKKKKRPTYLFAYIDDASRLITYAQFYYSQNFETLRYSLKEAVLKRGIPVLLYTDNGKIYRSQQFEYMCAGIGCTLIHAKPFSPNEKGKIERFFLTVRKRFLSVLNPENFKNIDDLNCKFFKWLDEDYQRKPHSSLNNISPLDVFMSQVSRINVISNPAKLNEKFLLRIKRKINHDATFTIGKIMFETDMKFAGSKIEIRYDPKWIEGFNTPVLIFMDDKKVGEGRRINFHDNAHMKRRGRPSSLIESDINQCGNSDEITDVSNEPEQNISFSDIMGGGN